MTETIAAGSAAGPDELPDQVDTEKAGAMADLRRTAFST